MMDAIFNRRIQQTFFFLPPPGARPSQTCVSGGSPGSRDPARPTTRTRGPPPRPTRTWAAARCLCPVPWRSWAGQPPPPPRRALRPPRPATFPSRTRILSVSTATRSRGRITRRWSNAWWWRHGRAPSWRTAWGAPRTCWSGSSATGAWWTRAGLKLCLPPQR